MNTPGTCGEQSANTPPASSPAAPLTVVSALDPKPALLFGYDAAPVRAAREAVHIDPDKRRALFVAERGRVDFVYNTAALEGNPLTFPEIQTLLDGITVGGHRLSDAEQVLRLNQALSYVVGLVKNNAFELTADTAKSIQGIVAKDEALEWGVFRNGPVFIQGTEYQVPPAEKLDVLFEQGRQALTTVPDAIHRAFLVFLWGSLIQFFYDGNKRTSRFLCNGILMSAGYPPMMITAKELLAYNQVMTRFYETQEATEALVWFYGRYLERIRHFGFISSSRP